jgi:hypothetical protein
MTITADTPPRTGPPPVDRLDLLAEPVLAAVAARSKQDPAAGWAAVGELIVTRALASADRPFPTPAQATLAQAADPGCWSLDREPDPGGSVVVVELGAVDDVVPNWTVFAAADLVAEPVTLPRGMAVWGGLVARPLPGSRPPAAAMGDRPGPGGIGPGAAGTLAVGAHALGVAARFRDAFVQKAAAGARGWSSIKTIDDPMVLKALQAGDGRLDGAAALLGARYTAAVAGMRTEAERADVLLAATAAIDAAMAATTALMTFTGASALFDGNAMQQTFAHLAAVAAHPMFGRAERLSATRAAVEPDVTRLDRTRRST